MSALSVSAQDRPAEKLLARNDPLVIAHRGASARAPENTLPAFQLAKEAGADLIELDYYHTRDGQPIVFHDKTLDRTTDAVAKWGGEKIALENKTLAELKTLDAGKWFDAKFAGTPMPTLAESLDCIQAGSVTLIERKAGDAATCVKLLKTRGELNKVIVQAFDWKYLADFHALEPKQILGALGPPSTRDGKKLTDAEKMLNAQYIAEARATGARVIGWNNKVTKESIAAAHAAEMEVWIYTVNKPEEANRLLDLGVDGIITDDPALIRTTIAARK
jgi:glycerophosphoryl diester phosphodiesterase